MFEKNKVWKNIKLELFPDVEPLRTVMKIFVLHIISVFIVLSFCPQFGFGLFHLLGLPQPFDVTYYFMLVSHSFCQIACGLVLFVFSSTVVYTQLKMTEKEWLLNQKALFYTLLVSLTGSLFVVVAPDITLLNVVLWTIGALTGLNINKIAKFKPLLNNNQ